MACHTYTATAHTHGDEDEDNDCKDDEDDNDVCLHWRGQRDETREKQGSKAY